MKTCKKCNKAKVLGDFYFYKTKNYRDGLCKRCRNENNRNWRITHTKSDYYLRLDLISKGQNKCCVCEKVKSLKAFHTSSRVKTGYKNTCKNCCSLQDKHTKLKTTYNISLDEYNSLLDAQNNECKICSISLIGKNKCVVDHCHKTNKVRGLLCHSCNRGLGLFKDRSENLIKAARYLKASPV